MSPVQTTNHERLIPGGFLLRPMQPTDLEAMVEFVTRVFGEVMDEPGPDLKAGIWARELLRGDHPTTKPDDGVIVLDPASGRIVASSFLISQTWQYDGIPFAVGRPELVASDPDYRGRGLIREVMTAIHARSKRLGHQMQALTGIPYYYRQYGYEPALITEGNRRGPTSANPLVPSPWAESIRIRPAAESDLPFITRMYEQATHRTLISARRDEPIWRHELLSRDPAGDYWHELRIIESFEGEPIGFFAYVAQLQSESVVCTLAELTDDQQWTTLAPLLLDWLQGEGEAIAERQNGSCTAIEFDWTPVHPLISAADDRLPERSGAFAWYIRIDDLAEFVRHLAPVLERRLAGSELAGWTGNVTFTFYPAGLRLEFTNGGLSVTESLATVSHRTSDAAIPGRTFYQLLLGSRSLEELEDAFPFETRIRTDFTRSLLTTLFPKSPSAVWPVA